MHDPSDFGIGLQQQPPASPDPLDDLREQIEAVRLRLGVLELKDKTPEELEQELRAEQLERAGFSSEQASMLLRLVEDAQRPIKLGVTRLSPRRLPRLRLESAARRRARFAPGRTVTDAFDPSPSDFVNVAYGVSFVDDESEGTMPAGEYIPGGREHGVLFEEPTICRAPRGVVSTPSSLLDFLPVAAAGMATAAGLYMMLHSRQLEPPRPWWQRALRRLMGV